MFREACTDPTRIHQVRGCVGGLPAVVVWGQVEDLCLKAPAFGSQMETGFVEIIIKFST